MSILSTIAPNLDRLHASRQYPPSLAAYLWKNKTEVPARFRQVSAFTVTDKAGQDLFTWFAFRAVNQRIPEFYAVELGQATHLSLYGIGAIGNTFDVDIVATDVTGAAQTAAWITDNSPQGPVILNGVYQAKPALYNEKTKQETVKAEANLPGIAILWVISYRHATYGSRAFRTDLFPISK